jgi:hypothetical protein
MGMSEDKPPTFFIPGCVPEEQEKVYASMARNCNVHVPGPGRRLYAISHHHDGDVWFVTVGKTLTGRHPVWKAARRPTRPALSKTLLWYARFPLPKVCVGCSRTAGLLPEGVLNGRILSWPVS